MSTATPVCQCCGQPLSRSLPARWDLPAGTFSCAGGSVRFRPQEARFFNALYRSRNRDGFRDPRDLLAAAYADDPGGGPNSISVVAVMTRQIRQKIEPIGWTVTRNMGVPRMGYRLVRLEQAKAIAA